MPSSRLAHNLDEAMLSMSVSRQVARGQTGPIARRGTPDNMLLTVAGSVVADELGGRYLVRYASQPGGLRDAAGRTASVYVSPTPFAPTEAVRWLALPRRVGFYLLLDAAFVPQIAGPRYVQFGQGLEFLLPTGFPAAAVVTVGTATGTAWPLPVS